MTKLEEEMEEVVVEVGKYLEREIRDGGGGGVVVISPKS